MQQNLEKRYGLATAIAMVVGIVIGSGIFFKAVKVLSLTGGSMLQSLLTVVVVGAIMVICAYCFSLLANKYEKINGIVDYAEATVGPRFGYNIGWFMTIMYYPILTSCLAWVSAQYTCSLFGWEIGGSSHVSVAAFYLLFSYGLNALSPKIAGYFQVSTTVIKLIPLGLMGVIGLIVGLTNGQTVDALTAGSAPVATSGNSGLLAAICAFAFAYEGWIITTSINAELKDSKKNLPRALVLGTIVVVIVYVLYFIGLTGALTVPEILEAGGELPRVAFGSLFGKVGGSLISVFIIISCLGTTNGLMLGCCRGMYSLAARGQGPAPKLFRSVDPTSKMPANSSIVGLLLCAFWLLWWQVFFWEGPNVLALNNIPAFFAWEPDELPIITIYASYIPIFLIALPRDKSLNVFQRFVLPILACIACLFMLYCAVRAYQIQALYYVIFFLVVLAVGNLFYRKKPKTEDIESVQE